MGSPHLDEELGRLSGQLKALGPALEHMEDRERQTVSEIATLKTKGDALRKDLDELVRKISARLKEVYDRLGRLETASTGNTSLLAAIEKGRVAIEKGRVNIWKRVWDVSKILIAIVLTALATKYLGGGSKP